MYMIRLRTLLQEFEYGKLLWGDPHDSAPEYREFIAQVYKGAMEPDTTAELRVWDQLRGYLRSNKRGALDQDTLTQLMRLKRRFPAILDPGLAASDRVYRGMTMPVAELVELIQTPGITVTSLQTSAYAGAYAGDWFRLDRVTRQIVSRREGFVSVTLDWIVARDFAHGNARRIGTENRWAIIADIPYAAVARRALMNPDFLAAAGGYEEREIWIVARSIPADVIYVASPWSRKLSDPAARSEESRQIAAALESRGITAR